MHLREDSVWNICWAGMWVTFAPRLRVDGTLREEQFAEFLCEIISHGVWSLQMRETHDDVVLFWGPRTLASNFLAKQFNWASR